MARKRKSPYEAAKRQKELEKKKKKEEKKKRKEDAHIQDVDLETNDLIDDATGEENTSDADVQPEKS